MLRPTTPLDDRTILSWWRAAGEAPVRDAFEALAEHAATVAQFHRPICLSSGRCCRFKDHGHSLLVTGLEAAWVLRRVRRRVTVAETTSARRNGVCVHLVEGQCSIHATRPLGCRAYYCDSSGGPWQADLAESLHNAVRRLHDDLSIEYLCAEWTYLVEALSQADGRGLLPHGLTP
ncbi:MAG: hypothetical protein EXS03_01055 [Phycisphaerales bacterium]|nr:hypothetical protein [Phycisphaerales bacterium]